VHPCPATLYKIEALGFNVRRSYGLTKLWHVTGSCLWTRGGHTQGPTRADQSASVAIAG